MLLKQQPKMGKALNLRNPRIRPQNLQRSPKKLLRNPRTPTSRKSARGSPQTARKLRSGVKQANSDISIIKMDTLKEGGRLMERFIEQFIDQVESIIDEEQSVTHGTIV